MLVIPLSNRTEDSNDCTCAKANLTERTFEKSFELKTHVQIAPGLVRRSSRAQKLFVIFCYRQLTDDTACHTYDMPADQK